MGVQDGGQFSVFTTIQHHHLLMMDLELLDSMVRTAQGIKKNMLVFGQELLMQIAVQKMHT